MADRDPKGRFLVGHLIAGPGRDSLYDPAMNEQARKLALLGLTDKAIAEFFGINEATLNNWKHEYPAFFESLNDGKIAADADVADSLYRRAIGEVVYIEKRVRTKDGDYEIIRLSQKVPADPGAAKLWLTNRQPAIWRDKREVDHTHHVDLDEMTDAELIAIAEEEAANRVLKRRTVRASLTEFCRLCGFEPARHHRLLIEALEAIARGDLEKLAVFMPPGSAKSTYVSVLFTAWVMQQQENILAASHTTELAEKWGRRVRNLIAEYRRILDVELAVDNLAAHRWATTKGAEYYAAGVGTGIAGFRGKYGMIDDPVRSRQDADSELIRDRTWDWYVNDFVPRLVPGSRQLLIQTRWHEDDLAGRALQRPGWHVISLPAICESRDDPLGRKIGEPLWNDDAYGYGAQLLDLQKTTPPRTWSALYQQRPAPEEGDYFKVEWLRPYTKLPPLAEMRCYGGSDYAVTADGGDYTVHAVVGLDPEGRMYLLALWRKQASSDVWIDAFCDLVRTWKPIGWAEEQGQIKASIGPFLERRQREREAYVHREQFPTRGDKAVRAQSIRGRMALEGLYVPVGAAWLPDFRHELLTFPAGKHDDQVDALGLIGQLLDRMVPGDRPETDKAKPKRSGYRSEPAVQAGNWRVN